MPTKPLSKRSAIWMAIAVTVIWSTSWVLIKIGLKEIPPLPFAGIRYFLAFLFLIPWLLRKPTLQTILNLTFRDWLVLSGLGLITYTLCQGGLYLSLSYLPNTTVSLLLNFSPILVAFAGGIWLNEKLNRWQNFGMVVLLAGAAVFFLPIATGSLSTAGLLFTGITLLGNVTATVYSRKILRSGVYPVVVITGVCMGIGSTALAAGSAAWQWIPRMSLQTWVIVLILAGTNTALAFTMWNLVLQKLTAFEANIINNTMLVQIAILSWIFLGDVITLKMAAGMLLVMAGAVLVNLRSGT
jgi:drug/metabolite transporter (DMT)-like permease